MVLDTRFPDAPPELDRELAIPPAPEPAASLDELLANAAASTRAAEHAELVQQLRQTIPGARGIELLWSILTASGDPRRRLAAQMLGHHREWLTSRSRVRSMVALAEQEQDPLVGCAMVWALRHQDAAAGFLVHAVPAMAREAALGVALNQRSLPALLDALLVAARLSDEVTRILLHKLPALHPSLVRDVVDYLLKRTTSVRASRLLAVFACLPQLPLFQILIEERQLPDWSPQKEEDAQRARIWQQLITVARKVLVRAPSFELVRYLLTRSGESDAFSRRHARLLKAAVQRADSQEGSDLVGHFERLTQRASDEKVARLAQLLVELSERLEGESGDRARVLLEQWKDRSTQLRLRIYQMQSNPGE
jgi:hypothetical protein